MNFHALNAKIHAMRGELFQADDYDALCHSGSVGSLGLRLNERPGYRKTLSGLEGADLHRNVLEERINLSLYDDYISIRHFFYDKQISEYFKAVFTQHLINYLKLLLNRVADERDIPYDDPALGVMFGHEYDVDMPKLASSKTVSEFIENLKGTVIYPLLATTYARNPVLFALERQLDLYYYLQLWKKQKKLPDTENHEIMMRIKGTEIDLRNIMWIFRLRYYYQVSGGNVYAYLIPINYRLKTAEINRMVNSQDVDELRQVIAAGPYGHVFGSFTNPEHAYTQAMRRVYESEVRRHPYSLATAVGYLFAREQEINNITSVLEGIRYGLPPTQILDYLCI